jgi:hypothetical protein
MKPLRGKSFKAEVFTSGDEDWSSNGLRFRTAKEAEQYGSNLADRWFAVKKTRVTPVEEKANYKFDAKAGAQPL